MGLFGFIEPFLFEEMVSYDYELEPVYLFAAIIEHFHVRLILKFFPLVTALSAVIYPDCSISFFCLAFAYVIESGTVNARLIDSHKKTLLWHYFIYVASTIIKTIISLCLVMEETEIDSEFVILTAWFVLIETLFTFAGFCVLSILFRCVLEEQVAQSYRTRRRVMENIIQPNMIVQNSETLMD